MWKVKKADLPFLTQAVGQALGFLTVQKHQRQIIYIYIYILFVFVQMFFHWINGLKRHWIFFFFNNFSGCPSLPCRNGLFRPTAPVRRFGKTVGKQICWRGVEQNEKNKYIQMELSSGEHIEKKSQIYKLWCLYFSTVTLNWRNLTTTELFSLDCC